MNTPVLVCAGWRGAEDANLAKKLQKTKQTTKTKPNKTQKIPPKPQKNMIPAILSRGFGQGEIRKKTKTTK